MNENENARVRCFSRASSASRFRIVSSFTKSALTQSTSIFQFSLIDDIPDRSAAYSASVFCFACSDLASSSSISFRRALWASASSRYDSWEADNAASAALVRARDSSASRSLRVMIALSPSFSRSSRSLDSLRSSATENQREHLSQTTLQLTVRLGEMLYGALIHA